MAYCSACGAEIDESATYCNGCGNEIGDPETEASKDVDLTHPAQDGFAFKHALLSGLLALIPAVVLSIVIPIPNLGGVGFLAGLVGFGYLGYKRPTVSSAFGRQSFWTAILLFLSPLLMIVYTFVFASQQTSGTAEQAGAAVGGTILVILAFLIGLPMGIAFYVLHNKYDIEE